MIAGAVREVVAAMRFAASDARLQEMACFVLARMVANSGAIKIVQQLVQEGAHEVLMNALRAFPRNGGVVRHARAALKRLIDSTVLRPDFVDVDLSHAVVLSES